jgi:hypothetical protein
MAPMALHVRRATADDLDAVAALTRRHRHQLAAWEPDFWRMAEGADQLHPLWLAHLLTSSDAVARVVVDDGDVAACAICVRQPAQWFADASPPPPTSDGPTPAGSSWRPWTSARC